METLIVVNGEDFWGRYLLDYEIHNIRLQDSRWLVRDGKLTVFDPMAGKAVKVDHVLWRGAPVRPFANHRAVLELIRLADVPCLNPVDTLLRSLNRLSMLNELLEIGLPVVPYIAIVGPHLMTQVQPELPLVIKIGNYHAGYGKMLISTQEQWQDMKDFIYVTDDFFTIEPYIDYKRDIRCLAVGEQVWALARNGSHWKANVGIVDNQLIPAPERLHQYTLQAMRHFKADVLGLDFLETHDGQYVLLESNEIPGLGGFPVTVIEALADRILAK